MLNQELTERYYKALTELHQAFLNYHLRRAFLDVARLACRDGREEDTAVEHACSLLNLVQARCHVESRERAVVFGQARYLQGLLQEDTSCAAAMEAAVDAWHENLAWFRKTMPRIPAKQQTLGHIFDYVESLDDEQIGATLCLGVPQEMTPLSPEIYAEERVAAFAALLPARVIEALHMHRQYTDFRRRMSQILRHVQVIDSSLLDAPAPTELEQMGFLFGLFCLHDARVRALADPTQLEDEDGGVARAVSFMRQSPDFWQWRLDEILASQAGLNEDVRGVLRHAVLHPRRLKRYQMAETVMPVRSALQQFTPVWESHDAGVERDELLRAIENGAWPEIRLALALFMVSCLRDGHGRTDRVDTLVARWVRREVLPRLAEIIETYTVENTSAVRTVEEIHWERDWGELVREEQARQEREAAERQAWAFIRPLGEPSSPESAAPPATSTTGVRSLRLLYVRNFGSATPRLVDLETDEATLDEGLEALATSEGLASSIRWTSVASAVRHYVFDTPPEIKRCMMKEAVGGVSWHKVKRGGMRIYLRETAGGILFHIIQRRDWENACLVERRFAHA